MYFKQFYDTDLAQGSYLIGCQQQGVAVVVDPRRDIEVYLADAAANGLRITAVTETHIHADYLSGSRELAAATGADLYLSDEGGEDWSYPFPHEALLHGTELSVGHVRLKAVHTPGHTPEHMMFLVSDLMRGAEPVLALTGDFVFVGDLGRPDLLDEAAGFVDTRFDGAKDLFASLRDHFLPLPDYVQVHPAHGSGSACGKALGAIPASTVSYERNFSWLAKYLKNNDEQGFVDELLSGQPDAHAYFGRMKLQNKLSPAILGDTSELIEYTATELAAALADDSVIFVDTRHNTEVHEGTVKHS